MFATFAGRATNIDTVYAELARIFETRTTGEWTELLEQADVPVMPMHDLESILRDPHLVATNFFPVVEHPTEGAIRNMKVSATWSESAAEPVRLAPRLNQHGAEILREAGFSADEIARLVRDGVTKAAPPTAQD
jgi:formyl-CoA transferase